MVSLIAFILSMIGTLNWFFIGVLQYDFVAGLFGSQANIFSRLIYFLVGVAGIVVTVNLIKNKGKFVISFKEAKADLNSMKQTSNYPRQKKLATSSESAKEHTMENTKESEK